MRIVYIGAGRLACNLAPTLHQAGHEVIQVYSRTLSSATALAERLGAEAVSDLSSVSRKADVYLFSVTDTALPALAKELGEGREQAVFLHTAGSIPLSVFPALLPHHGVLYPMQTFSKERKVDLAHVPFFIEGSDELSLHTAQMLASSVSSQVRELSSEDRRHLHLAAVFACNFANHCYELSAEILQRHGLPFEVMLPLIDETAAKVHELSPVQAQTGPAVRYDENVMQAQLQLLSDLPFHAQAYELLSRSIHHSQQTYNHHD